MLYFVIPVRNILIMNSLKFEQSVNHEDVAIELDMKNFMKYSSDLCRETEISDDSIRRNSKIINYKTEDCADLGKISSISEYQLQKEEKVRDTYTFCCFIM